MSFSRFKQAGFPFIPVEKLSGKCPNWKILLQATGVKARLSQKGINYITTFLKDIMIDQVIDASPSNNEEFQLQVICLQRKVNVIEIITIFPISSIFPIFSTFLLFHFIFTKLNSLN